MKYFFGFVFILLLSWGTVTFAASGLGGNTTGSGSGAGTTGSGVGGGTTGSGLGGGTTGSGLGSSPVEIKNPIEADSIIELFQTLIDIILIFAVPIIVFFIIYAGFLYVTARGNAGTIETAHKALLYALIGGLLILGARVLIEVIQGTVDSIIKK